jgi:hypothetical protein
VFHRLRTASLLHQRQVLSRVNADPIYGREVVLKSWNLPLHSGREQGVLVRLLTVERLISERWRECVPRSFVACL